jgi:DNA-binding CsgD family transcriptional regulator
MLRDGDVLGLAKGKLLAPGVCQTRLSQSIAAATSPDAPTAKSFMLQNAKRRRWVANAAPFLMRSGARFALLMVHELGGSNSRVVPRLQELFDLSGAEAAVAGKLADGQSPSEIASDRGVSLGTVRAQLKTIASKLDCHRQAEIVSLVKSLG